MTKIKKSHPRRELLARWVAGILGFLILSSVWVGFGVLIAFYGLFTLGTIVGRKVGYAEGTRDGVETATRQLAAL